MRAVMSQVPEHFLERRKRIGADRWDEMWEGELHMPPAPNLEHQDLEWAIESWLRSHWAPRRGSKVYHQINVASRGSWPNDYRLPDLVLLTPDRFHVNKLRTPDIQLQRDERFHAPSPLPQSIHREIHGEKQPEM